MKAQLTFNLPEDQESFQTHLNAGKYYCSIHDMLMWLRQKYKYENVTELQVEDVREKMFKILEDHDIDGEF